MNKLCKVSLWGQYANLNENRLRTRLFLSIFIIEYSKKKKVSFEAKKIRLTL